MKQQTPSPIAKTQFYEAVLTPRFQETVYSMAAAFSLAMTSVVVFWYLTSGF